MKIYNVFWMIFFGGLFGGLYCIEFPELPKEVLDTLYVVYKKKGDVVQRDFILDAIRQEVKSHHKTIVNNPYKKVVAHVRIGDSLPEEEIEFREQRFDRVKQAQSKFLSMNLEDEDVLEITFSLSGGGMRAALGALGSCNAAQQIGLLDCVMCVASLSGSTWFLSSWISSGLSLAQYKQHIMSSLAHGLEIDSLHDIKRMIDTYLIKFAYKQPMTIVDLYGSLLAELLFKIHEKKCDELYMGTTLHKEIPSQKEIIASGDYPLPVYTAVLGNEDCQQEWFEWTPYEVGSRWLGAYIPTWAFGRKFDNGVSVDNAPEQMLGYDLGIFGSAFAFNFEKSYKLIKNTIKVPWLSTFLDPIFEQTPIGKLRAAWAEVRNFTYNMKKLPLANKKTIKLVDAGLDFMNPIFASYRNPEESSPDVVFVFDYGASGLGQNELALAAAYAEKKGIEFPLVDDPESGKRTCTIFKDDVDLEKPIVVYMPRIMDKKALQACQYHPVLKSYYTMLMPFDIENEVNSGFAHTLNFIYSYEEAQKMAALTEFNLLVNAPRFKKLLQERVLAKRVARRIKK